MSRKIRIFFAAVLALLIYTTAYSMTTEEAKKAYDELDCEITSFNEFGYPTCADCNDLTQLIANYKPSWDAAPFQTTIEAETMTTKTTGGSISGGWNIWSNGRIEDTVEFPEGGTYTFEIIAKGSVASGDWPNMELMINQIAKAMFTVNTTDWKSYTVQIIVPAESHKVAIAFTNDLKTLTQDRNLYVDKIIIRKGM